MPHNPVRILGLDPGFARAGYAILESDRDKITVLTYGCIKTIAGDPYPQRLQELDRRLASIIREYRPTVAALEKLFFSKNVKTALAVGQARGVLLLLLQKNGVPCSEFSPQEVKMAATGYGAAEKRQVQLMVQRLLRLATVPTPDDAADALAIALAAVVERRPYDRAPTADT